MLMVTRGLKKGIKYKKDKMKAIIIIKFMISIKFKIEY